MIWDEITFIAEFWLELGDLLSAKLLFLKSPISILDLYMNFPKLSLIQSFKVEILSCLYLCWISKFGMPPIWKESLKGKTNPWENCSKTFQGLPLCCCCFEYFIHIWILHVCYSLKDFVHHCKFLSGEPIVSQNASTPF